MGDEEYPSSNFQYPSVERGMFTGIIEGAGKVLGLTAGGASGRLRVELGALAEGVRVGDSVSVDGACLTVARVGGGVAEFDVSAETLRVSTLAGLATGREVNLERSLRVGDRLGGHFVLGHVDGVGRIERLEAAPGQVTLTVSAAPEILSCLILKGSIAVDGISLTLADVAPDRFSVAVIPHTLDHTTLRRKSAGDRVNLELDVIGKYVARFLSASRGGRGAMPSGRLTEGFLEEHGFK
jgi:riboflavin synthase